MPKQRLLLGMQTLPLAQRFAVLHIRLTTGAMTSEMFKLRLMRIAKRHVKRSTIVSIGHLSSPSRNVTSKMPNQLEAPMMMILFLVPEHVQVS